MTLLTDCHHCATGLVRCYRAQLGGDAPCCPDCTHQLDDLIDVERSAA